MVTVGIVSFEAGAVTCAQDIGAVVRHECHFAGDDVDELIAVGVPVALGRPAAGWKLEQCDTDLCQPGGLGQAFARARRHGASERRGVTRSDMRCYRSEIELLAHQYVRALGGIYSTSLVSV